MQYAAICQHSRAQAMLQIRLQVPELVPERVPPPTILRVPRLEEYSGASASVGQCQCHQLQLPEPARLIGTRNAPCEGPSCHWQSAPVELVEPVEPVEPPEPLAIEVSMRWAPYQVLEEMNKEVSKEVASQKRMRQHELRESCKGRQRTAQAGPSQASSPNSKFASFEPVFWKPVDYWKLYFASL